MQKGYHTCLPHGNSRTARVIIACRDAGGEVDLIMLAHIRRRHAVDGRLDSLAVPIVLVGLVILPATCAVGGGLAKARAEAKAKVVETGDEDAETKADAHFLADVAMAAEKEDKKAAKAEKAKPAAAKKTKRKK